MESHGGSRQGAGRPSTSEKQISVRVSNRTIEAIEAFDINISTAVRQMIDYAAGADFCLDEKNGVWAKFAFFEEIEASTGDEAFNKLINFIKMNFSPIYMYACRRNLLTVKGRLPLSNDSSLWVYVKAQRTTPPTDDEFNDDKQKILQVLENRKLTVKWYEEP